MIFQSHMEALRAEPVAKGEMPASSVHLVSKVLSQSSSHQFLKSVGIKTSASSKASSSNQSELREQLAAEATTAIQGELDQLRKKCEEAEDTKRVGGVQEDNKEEQQGDGGDQCAHQEALVLAW
jgi:hypothetical protein